MYIKQRLFALLLIVACGGMVYYGWYVLRTQGEYYLKMATFAPLGVVGGIFLLLFPTMGWQAKLDEAKGDRNGGVCDRDRRRISKLVPDGPRLLWF